MKKVALSFLFVISCCFSSMTLAGSGSAIIPYWSASTNAKTDIRISNISQNQINVKITFYDRSGNVISPSSYLNFQNSDTQLASKMTGQVSVSSSSSKLGYAIIEWENEESDDDTVALVAHGVYQVLESSRRTNTSIPINNGQPF